MPYTQPGVTVENKFQLIANPNTGSTIQPCVVGQITANIEAHPIRSTEILRSSLVATTQTIDAAVLTETFTTPTVNPGLYDVSVLTEATRLYSMLYDRHNYNALRTNAPAIKDLVVVEATRGSGVTDVIATTVAYDAAKTNVLPIISGQDYNSLAIVTEDGAVCTAESFALASGTGGTDVTVTFTLSGNEPATGKKYYFILGYVNTTDISTDTVLKAAIKAAQCYYFNALDTSTSVVNFKVIWKLDLIDTDISGTITVGDSSDFLIAPPAGATYTVITKVEFPSTIKPYSGFSEVAAEWGDAVLSTGVINHLSFAAYLAFSEGSSLFMIAGYDATSKDSAGNHRTIDETFSDSMLEDSIKIITVLDSSIPIDPSYAIKKLSNHVLSASSVLNKKYRIGIAGIDVTNSQDEIQDYANTVQSISSNRMVLVGPSTVTFALTLPGSSTMQKYVMGAEYLSVIMAAMWGRPESDVATSLTRKESRTIIDLSPKYNDSKLNLIASKGVSLFAKVRGRYVMRDDITTNTVSLLESQPYVTLTSDDVATSAIETLDTQIIGMKMLIPVTQELVKQALVSMLELKQKENLISAYGSITIIVDPTNPLKLLITIPVVPMMSVKQIDITFLYVLRA